MATEDTAWVAICVSAHRAARDKHDVRFSMIGAEVGILHGGPPKFRECHHHQVVPGGLVAVVDKILSQRIHRPADSSEKVRLAAGERPLITVGVEPSHLGSGYNCVRVVQ